VGAIDIDARQGTLSRYIENRRKQQEKHPGLLIPQCFPLHASQENDKNLAEKEESAQFEQALESLQKVDILVIDTPGSDKFLSRLAHSYADTLITPLNDSFIDLDMLVRLSPEELDILRPSTYAEMVWDQKKCKALRKEGSIDWIVLRNRLTSIYSRNKEDMQRVLAALAKRIGFRLVDGFGERVIFRELFLKGLTLLDPLSESMTLSHVSGRQELAQLVQSIELPEVPAKAKAIVV
jgi:chromosome partitioning protein